MNATFLDDLAARLAAAVPPGARELQRDMEKNLRAVLQNSFARMNLVTRDEFDVQTRVLANARRRIDELEQRVATLEQQSDIGKPQPPHSDTTS